MPPDRAAASAITACIQRCRTARDGRGRWRAELAAAQAMGGDAIARNCAAAARRLGEWLPGLKGPVS